MASKLYNLVRFTTSTTGTGTTVAVGAAVSGYLTPALAGISNGDVVDLAFKDGSNSQVGTATYSSTGPQFTGLSITKSTNSNSPISLSGAAEVFITPRAETLADASFLTAGTVATVRLGSGTASSTTALFGDQTYKTIFNTTPQIVASTQTVTILATKCLVEGVGGGGGFSSGNNGGSGAGAFRKTLTGLTVGNTLAATIGAGGTTSGTAGSSTTLASGTQPITTLTASGGVGNGGTPGTGTNGDQNFQGQTGSSNADTGGCSTLFRGVGGMGGLGMNKGGGVGNGTSQAGDAGYLQFTWYN